MQGSDAELASQPEVEFPNGHLCFPAKLELYYQKCKEAGKTVKPLADVFIIDFLRANCTDRTSFGDKVTRLYR